MLTKLRDIGLDKKIFSYFVLLAIVGFAMFALTVSDLVPHDASGSALDSSRNKILLFGLIFNLIGLMLVYYFVWGIIKPIRSLREVTSRIADGNLSELTNEIPESGSGEVLDLIRSFNKMRQGVYENSQEILQLNSTLERKIENRTKKLADSHISLIAILDALHDINSKLDIKMIMRSVAQHALRICRAESGMAGWIENGTIKFQEIWDGKEWKKIDINCQPESCSNGCLPKQIDIAAFTRHQQIINDENKRPDGEISAIGPVGSNLLDFELRNWINAPILNQSGDLLGFVEIYNKIGGDKFVNQDIVNLSILASHGSSALETTNLFDKISKGKKEWETTYDAIPDLITIHDKRFNITRYNKAAEQKLGKGSSLLGKKCYQVFHGRTSHIGNCPFFKAMREKKPQSIEIVEDTLNGVYNILVAPLFKDGDPAGEVTGCVHVVRDITKQYQLQEQLLQSEKLSSIGELVSGVAHELNNPLTSVLGFAQLLDRKVEDEDIKKDISKISHEAKRAAKIINNLLTFSRKESAKTALVGVEDVIERTLDLRAYDLNLSNIAIERSYEADMPKIMADAMQLQQVILNLLNNAEHAINDKKEGGKIKISTFYNQAKQMIEIDVSDNGTGISEESLGRIFDPFYTTKEVGKGTGLGLSVSYGIILQHGGQIMASNNEDGGATIKVYLPIQSVTPEKETSSSFLLN